jgi:SAM-dependent methyltransferase
MKEQTTFMPLSSESELLALPLTDSLGRRKVPSLLFAATILLSAFLLFQVQPLIAKLILPWFGGSAAVWTSCMLFFQMALLGGYAYAHWLNGQSGARQKFVHVGLLVLSFAALPILPSPWWKPQGAEDPLLRILGLLAVTVGLPYFLLSSTSPLLQSWYSRSNGGGMPYRFFALSNAGSMLGLLTYPVLVEPYLTNRQQAWMWSISYIAFVLVCGLVAWWSRGGGHEVSRAAAPVNAAASPNWADRFIWMGLAASASALLLAVTNHLTQNIAAIPFLWVLPLSLYLLSFILCFDSDRWYNRFLFSRLGAIAILGIAYAISSGGGISELKWALSFFCSALFVLFMLFHGELARRRPAPAFLTSFYLMVSVGGAIGGLLIGFAAPYLFTGVYDLQVVICLAAFLLVYLLWRGREKTAEPAQFLQTPGDKATGYVLIGALTIYIVWMFWRARTGGAQFLNASYDPWVMLGVAGVIGVWMLWRARGSVNESIVMFALMAAVAVGMTGYLVHDTWHNLRGSVAMARNFYGALYVYDQDTDGKMGPVRVLRHGTIDHGEQFLWPQNQRFATTYYSAGSGVGLAIRNLQMQGPMNVGVIGLGAGTLTTYGRPGDHYAVYDINPLVLKIAQYDFRYLRECMATKEIVLGDARLSLEQELSKGPKQFDVLAVDAFSGDAIPVHLLTREAFALYWRHLKPDGVLAVHVSNRYLALGPVVALAAAEDGKQAMMISNEDDDDKEISAADWVLVSSRPGFFEQNEIKSVDSAIKPVTGLRTWTDDYSNLYKILR